MRGCVQGQRCGVHSARGLRAIAAFPRTSILLRRAGRRLLARGQRTEDHSRPVPVMARGDGGQARISRALPVEAIGDDGDGVALGPDSRERAPCRGLRWRRGEPPCRASPSKNLRLSDQAR